MKTSPKRTGRMLATVLGSFLIALVLAVIAALITDRIETCPSGDCQDSLLSFAVFLITLAVAPAVLQPILAGLAHLGRLFIAGSTFALVLLGIGTYGIAMSWYAVFYPLGLAVLVVTFVRAASVGE